MEGLLREGKLTEQLAGLRAYFFVVGGVVCLFFIKTD